MVSKLRDQPSVQDKTAALRYIGSAAGQGQAVKYLEDSSLPSGWRCQRIQTSIYYFSPRGERSVHVNLSRVL